MGGCVSGPKNQEGEVPIETPDTPKNADAETLVAPPQEKIHEGSVEEEKVEKERKEEKKDAEEEDDIPLPLSSQ